MSTNGLLIDIDLCTGCHSCEVACKLEKGLQTGQFGIKLAEDKPWQIDERTWEYKWLPVPTQICDLCANRVEQDKTPSCVLHCCSHCIKFGDLADLAVQAKEIGRRTATFTIG